MRRNPDGRILKGKLKEYHLSTVPKSCSIFYYIFIKINIVVILKWHTDIKIFRYSDLNEHQQATNKLFVTLSWY